MIESLERLKLEELAEKVANKAVEVYEAKCKALAEIKLDYQRIEREKRNHYVSDIMEFY